MIYPDKNGVAIMGENGFIGSSLNKIREHLAPGVYFFDSPSSGVLFDENLDYCMEQSINDFLQVIQYCRDHNTYLVYPSSATVYNKNTNYAHCKAAIEEIAACYPMVKSLGLRISASYGPGEKHKGEYASVIYQWCKQMKAGEPPTIFGDGTQTRDFIYEDDTARNIANFAQAGLTGIVDVGSGVDTSFNQIVEIINQCLGTNIIPLYVPKPTNYVGSTPVQSVPRAVPLREGIQRTINSL